MIVASTKCQRSWARPTINSKANVNGRKKTAPNCRTPLTILAIRKVRLPRGSFAQVLSWSGGRGKAERCTSWSGGWRRNLWSILVCLGCSKTVACWRVITITRWFWSEKQVSVCVCLCVQKLLPDCYTSEAAQLKTNKDPSASCCYLSWTFYPAVLIFIRQQVERVGTIKLNFSFSGTYDETVCVWVMLTSVIRWRWWGGSSPTTAMEKLAG